MKKIYAFLFALMITGLGYSQTTIFSEAGGGAAPTDWTFENNITTNDVDRGSYWLVDAGNPSDVITTATYDLSSYTDAEFTLDVATFGSGTNHPAKIEISFDGGSNYTQTETTNAPTSSTYIDGGVISLNSVSSQVVIRISNNGTSGRGVRLRNLELTASGVASGCTAPFQASNFITGTLNTTDAMFSITRGGGNDVLVVMREGSAVDTDPTSGTSYTANSIFAGAGASEIGTGNFVIFNGNDGTSNPGIGGDTLNVSVSGLTPGTTYHVAIYEYNTVGTCYELSELTGNFTTSAVTSVQFATTSASVEETVGTYDLVIEIADENASATTFDVVLTSGDAADIDSYTTQSESFPGSSTTDIIVTVTITDDAIIEADEVFTFEIQNVAGGNSAIVGINNSFDLTILANDAPPPIEGWQITSEETSFVIDFETTVPNVNEDAFDASGFTTSPSSGQLDSDAWEATGMSDGDLSYGGSQTSGDYTRGTSSGGVTSGGFYAFDTGGSNSSLGVQSTGSDFSPGTITLRAQNQTGTTVTAANVAYLIYVLNNEGRASSFNFSYSTDDITYTDVSALDFTSTEIADGSPAWTSTSRSTSISGLSIADEGYLYLRWSSDDVSGSGSRDEIALDDIELIFNPAAPTVYTFNGSWSPSDPNGMSTSGDDIVIASGDATINSNTTCNSMTVNPGAGLIVNTGSTLTVVTDLTLESSSTSYSSLILDGTVTGTINYERHVNINGSGTTGSNDLISAPLTGQVFSDFATANPNILSNGAGTLFLFGPFDKTIGDYVTYSNTESATLDAGIGYRAASDNNGSFTFTGTANNGTITNDITNSGPVEAEWNLVGNPYPSYLNVHSFLNHEVSTGVSNLALLDAGTAAIYGYDGNAVNGWTIYNLATTTAATVIAPGQGFFVSADATNAPLYDLEFTPDMRSTGTSDDFIANRNVNGTLIHFTLNLSSSTDSFETEFYFNPNATAGFDFGFDAELFTNPSFSLFSYLVEENEGDAYQIQALNTSNLDNTTIPLGVRASQGVQLTFSISLNELPSTIEIFLDDTVENTTTLLNNSDYVFTPATPLAGAGRFFIRTNDTSLSTLENSLDSINIYALNNSKELVVNGQLQHNSILKLYDIQGRLVLSKELDNTLLQNRIDVSALSGGVYVVNVQNTTKQRTQKVIIK